MSNELTDVRCPCGDEYPADSYDAGFIAGSGMCQNCDAALPPKDICTCPSGDGSLRHPCPEHPAVEQVGANVGHGHVFPRADGVKMRCGGPGLCSECAADASRARAALAHRSEFHQHLKECADEVATWPSYKREALTQPSPAQAEQAEAEQPEAVDFNPYRHHAEKIRQRVEESASVYEAGGSALGYMEDIAESALIVRNGLDELSAQHERIVGALRSEIAEWQEAAGRSRSDVVAYIAERAKLLEERDAAQARVAGLEAELETERMRLAACGTAALGYFDGCADAYKSASLSDVLRLRGDCDAALARVAEFEAQAQHSVPVVTPEMVMAAMAVFRLDVSPFKSMEAALIAALRKAAAPGKEGV
ncbi:hypothetical protein ACRROF_000158 [Pseudomonas aeruginosa]